MITLVKRLSLAAALAGLAAPLFAQQTLNGGITDTLAALKQAPAPAAAAGKAVSKAAEAKASSCADAQELETTLEATLIYPDSRRPRDLTFTYRACREEGRNDYLPPYTERGYDGPEGYGLTIVTNDRESASEVLMSKGKEWVGSFGKVSNAAILSGRSLEVGAVTLKEAGKEVKVPTQLRSLPREKFPQAKACQDALKKTLANNVEVTLYLLTDTEAFYYYEDCDICAELDRCDLATTQIREVKVAHQLSCNDLDAYRKGKIVYDCKDTGGR